MEDKGENNELMILWVLQENMSFSQLMYLE